MSFFSLFKGSLPAFCPIVGLPYQQSTRNNPTSESRVPEKDAEDYLINLPWCACHCLIVWHEFSPH